MKNSFYILFLTILIFASAKAENLNIESRTISLDKENKLAVFKDEVVAQDDKKNTLKENYKKILIAAQPIIPHFSNECLELLNVSNFKWPKFDENILKEENINLVIQILKRIKLC